MFDASFYLCLRGGYPTHVTSFRIPPQQFICSYPVILTSFPRNLTSQFPHVRCCIMINAVHSHNPFLSSYSLILRKPFIHLPVAFTCSVDSTSSSLSHLDPPSFFFL
ncbi:uncharacterized protein AKAW2_11168S [Aspergillus luchuensis]|uniref:Uncharacterized protein n=1 Tax=Aspergillus kawachii TaxID=1069201 RepID=A0A7R7W0I3_ASPKA|nr:uncharacterized protein AKAW2_11168S [Aspergillus luchuensis]BCR94122.1 hypothetical protein AKAW2_11168S [Aspergillus luchuensis]